MLFARATRRSIFLPSARLAVSRHASTASPSPSLSPSQWPVNSAAHSHRVVVVGAGTAGLTISHQLLRSKRFSQDEIAVIDPSAWHHYQPGWTLVGGGLKAKDRLRRPLQDLISPRLKFYRHTVNTFCPDSNMIMLDDGCRIAYEHLVVVPGIEIDYGSIRGLPQALENPSAPVSSIYGYEFCDKAFKTIENLKKGTAIFTQPTGIVKCAGAPQKIMWLALDHWQKTGRYTYRPGTGAATAAVEEDSPIKIKFATGLASLFGVPKYSAVLEQLRCQRGVEGSFQHDLVAIEGNQAVFNVALPHPEGDAGRNGNGSGSGTVAASTTRKVQFDLLHVVPKMGPYAFIKKSPISDKAGYVEVDEATTRHRRYSNIWSAGDASSLPTSKTVAAITGQAPVLVHNLLQAMDGKPPDAVYDGYTSCPLLTEYGKVLLAEFKYGGEPSETFNRWFGIDQAVPRRAFYHLKKDFFPWVYYSSMVKGTWRGPKGWSV
ncbi:hypothetical protein AN1825.2 [Aspergillus nidulans FGSC A4]|jgi:NADPH-dependent 2,4-dienoyl-CoA reductase/sulfur reductase-like enzyme|uniref:FAD/NAD(P)-binding domain-containing protein n=1 Tax=Emericella nidulans (strain FGSC A4 / ATCC 38163 / CBS 112.46 / NRRL 194 / M139) TaxID=227321 RepID=Q5BCA5_EMENI|nr:hypothetical protein [Aspergillus nidulans FGSC A4]EAA64990.1 hypothetical protein AN1825.2 [Aspergillus nidulans FGSC A4]CBF85635.1 TPA: conserved hypothetical protein [Aspergillus nidulans FGSC A4]|eukprot:XP_659429.1 hypothetical protein AN1825.2 [Aspergillus nidulans FGSC A4]